MKKRALSLLLLSTLLVGVCSLTGCKNNKEQLVVEEVPIVENEVIIPDGTVVPSDSEANSKKESNNLLVKIEITDVSKAVTNQINDYIPFEVIDDSEIKAYNDFMASIGESLSESEQLLQNYGLNAEITTSNITDTTVDVNVKVPYLLKIYLDKVENCETEEELNLAVSEAIANKDYELLDKTFTLNYTVNENGGVTIEETYEYVDALYGGMQSFLDIMQQASMAVYSTEEVSAQDNLVDGGVVDEVN